MISLFFFPKTLGCYYGVSGPWSYDCGGHMSKFQMCFRSSIRASSYILVPTWGTSGTSWTLLWCPAPSPHSITPWRKLLTFCLVKLHWLTFSYPISLKNSEHVSKEEFCHQRKLRYSEERGKCLQWVCIWQIDTEPSDSHPRWRSGASSVPGPIRDMGTFEWPGDSGHIAYYNRHTGCVPNYTNNGQSNFARQLLISQDQTRWKVFSP